MEALDVISHRKKNSTTDHTVPNKDTAVPKTNTENIDTQQNT